MDFSLSEEQQEVRDLARKILEDRCTHERLKQVEASADGVDLELGRELARANLLGVGLPEAYGGSDLGFFTTCLLLEELGRTVAQVPALATLVMGALPIARFGSEAQRRRWLPGVASGELILSAALRFLSLQSSCLFLRRSSSDSCSSGFPIFRAAPRSS